MCTPVSKGRLGTTKNIVILIVTFTGDCYRMLALTALVENIEIIETFCNFMRYLEQDDEFFCTFTYNFNFLGEKVRPRLQ